MKPPSSNPKDRIGITKVPLGLLPPAPQAHTALALLDGAIKYGRWNWREESVAASVYIDACLRHIADWVDGQEQAEDSKVHHLGHAAACLFIIMDAQQRGNMIDDRTPHSTQCAELFTKLIDTVKHLYEKNNQLVPQTPSLAEAKTVGEASVALQYEVLKGWKPADESAKEELERIAEAKGRGQEGMLADHLQSRAQLEPPSLFVKGVPIKWEPEKDEECVELADGTMRPNTIPGDDRIERTECILGHAVCFLPGDSSGYIDGEYLQGTAFTSRVARYRRGFENVDDEVAAQYAKDRS
jgi:hypothetical protein